MQRQQQPHAYQLEQQWHLQLLLGSQFQHLLALLQPVMLLPALSVWAPQQQLLPPQVLALLLLLLPPQAPALLLLLLPQVPPLLLPLLLLPGRCLQSGVHLMQLLAWLHSPGALPFAPPPALLSPPAQSPASRLLRKTCLSTASPGVAYQAS